MSLFMYKFFINKKSKVMKQCDIDKINNNDIDIYVYPSRMYKP